DRDGPTPLVEGKEQDRVVLGRESVVPVPFHVKLAGNRWMIDGGKLHGLTEGSVLVVMGKDGKPTGHVRITESLAVGSEAQAGPLAGGGKRERLEGGSPCKPVFIDYGILKPRVAAVTLRFGKVPDNGEQMNVRRLAEQLRAAAGNPSFFEVVDDPAAARWLL